MPIDRYEMKTLPIAGAELVKICFCGNGKDSEASIEVKGARKSVVALSSAAMDLTFAGPITMRTYSHDDSAVVMEIAPTAEHPMVLDEVAVGFYGDDETWAKILRYYTEVGSLEWCVQQLRLSVRKM